MSYKYNNEEFSDEYCRQLYIMMLSFQTLQGKGISVKETFYLSLEHLLWWYQESQDMRYLDLALLHMQAYVNMGFAINEKNQTICDILKESHKTIDDFFPRGHLPGKRVKLNKTQVRSMIGRWKPSKNSPMTIGQLVDDIIQKVKTHQIGRYVYEYHRAGNSADEDAEVYELVINEEESYFYDVKKFRFYTFMEETGE